MSNIFTTTLRLNLDNEEDRRAFDYLRSLDRKKYRSYSRVVVAAVNDYFSRQERHAADPFLETRERQEAFLQEVRDTIAQSLQGNGTAALAALLQNTRPMQKPTESMSDEAYDTAMDFMNAL